MTTTRAIAYVRVSTDEQATSGVSLSAQESKLRAYCEALEITLVRVEIDAGISASTLNRPALQRALAALKRGEAEALLVVKLDRLTRSVRDLCSLVDDYFRTRSSLISLGEAVDTRSAAGRMVLNLLASVSQWEREAIGERTASAMAHMRAQGRYTGGGVPFGYRLAEDGETLVEHADEQAVIATARQLKAEGRTIRAIAAHLGQPIGRVQRVLAA